MRSRTTLASKVLLAFGAAVLVVAGLTAATWWLVRDAMEAAHWVRHTQEVLLNLTHVRADALQIELNTQSYRMSGNDEFLVERDQAIAARENRVRQIGLLTGDNPRQQERLVRLRQVIDERLTMSRRTELLRRTQGQAAADAYVAGATLRETRERMYQVLLAMEEEERGLLAQRLAEQDRVRLRLVVVGTLAALLLTLLLAGAQVLIRRQLRENESGRRALAESEENLAITLHSIGDAVLATDTEGCVTRMNPVAERLTGWPLTQARGQPVEQVFRIIHEITRAPAVVPVARALETGEVQGLDDHTVLIARDGTEYPIADSAAPIRDALGRLTGVVLVFRDVSAERRAERLIREQNERLEQRVRERTAQLQESEERFRLLVDGARDYAIIMLDPQGRVMTWNAGAQRLKGYAEADILGQPMERFYPPEDVAAGEPARLRAQAAADGRSEDEGWRVRQDGTRFYADMILTPLRGPAGELLGFAKVTRDITERQRTQEQVRRLHAELEQRVREMERAARALRILSAGNRAMLHAGDELALLDDMCQAILEKGGYAMALVCYGEDSAVQALRPMAVRGYPGGLAALRGLQERGGEGEPDLALMGAAIRDGHIQVRRGGGLGGGAAMACPLRIEGEVIGALLMQAGERDAFDADERALLSESADDLAFGIATFRTQIKQQQAQQTVHRLTHYDALTGLPNETQFVESLNAAIAEGERLNRSFALLQINIERLSEINDALGFGSGDQLLREFGATLRSVATEAAVVARLRGDEFAVLLPEGTANTALAMTRHLEEALTQPFLIADIPIEVSVRVGVAVFPGHGRTSHDLLRHLDMALQQARKRGLRHVIFDGAQEHIQPNRLTMAAELRRAIEGGDLRLYLQPKVELAGGRVCGAEGLVRWRHAKRGLIPPDEFIGLAEYTGLIKPLTEWVIEAALRLQHGWRGQDGALPIAVNLSARNLRDEELIDRIHSLCGTWGVAANQLELEITESTVMEDAEFSLRVLQRLRDEGFALYIDDFGTGYSSLSYLQKLPVNYIKIDQSFVRAMSVSREARLIVRSTIDLSHDLGHKVVGEGVETRDHWGQLTELGCDIAQGYFLAKPMPAEDFPAWVGQYCPPV